MLKCERSFFFFFVGKKSVCSTCLAKMNITFYEKNEESRWVEGACSE